ncbi:intracellular iron chaperone frataxin [Lachnospiraceae bacterium]|jgi:uncharacterized protein YdhG (YjbR/CyaY superfamily)|nr:iron chaperone [Lachnospiraceae bacterium]MCX4272644.1 iron chaperone [Acetatifactor sp.]GFH97490.1 intracellular iron chaperone frataxin [Lachnospiraceae bacterium]
MHDKIKAAEVFEKYLSRIENETHRVRMREVLEWTKTRFPGLEPKIAWNQPVFTDHGTFIIGFSAAKQHFSVAPEPAAIRKFSREIQASGYSQGTNLFRIRWEEPVDYALLERIIEYNRQDKADCSAFWRK